MEPPFDSIRSNQINQFRTNSRDAINQRKYISCRKYGIKFTVTFCLLIEHGGSLPAVLINLFFSQLLSITHVAWNLSTKVGRTLKGIRPSVLKKIKIKIKIELRSLQMLTTYHQNETSSWKKKKIPALPISYFSMVSY